MTQPSEHDRVLLDVTIYLNGKVFIEDQRITFDLGHAEDFGVIKVLDRLASKLSVGTHISFSSTVKDSLSQYEQDLLKLSDQPDSSFKIEVVLLDVLKLKRFWDMCTDDRASIAKIMHARGNKLFKSGSYSRSLAAYKLAIRMLDGAFVEGSNCQKGELKTEDEARLVSCFSNAGLCLLRLTKKLENSDSFEILHRGTTLRSSDLAIYCIKVCEKGLKLDPSNYKLLFTMASACAILKDFDSSVVYASKALAQLNTSEANFSNVDASLTRISQCLSLWRKAAYDQQLAEGKTVREAFCKRVREMIATDTFYCDLDGADFEINSWSNSLADKFMSLHEELEAFGEKMPERSAVKEPSSFYDGNVHLDPIDDAGSDSDD